MNTSCNYPKDANIYERHLTWQMGTDATSFQAAPRDLSTQSGDLWYHGCLCGQPWRQASSELRSCGENGLGCAGLADKYGILHFLKFSGAWSAQERDLVLHTRVGGYLVFYLQHSNSALAPSHVLAMSCPVEEIHFLHLKRLSCFMKYTWENIFPNILKLKIPQTNSL